MDSLSLVLFDAFFDALGSFGLINEVDVLSEVEADALLESSLVLLLFEIELDALSDALIDALSEKFEFDSFDEFEIDVDFESDTETLSE
ncbi:hypothetical protein JC2156_16380 [Weissella koreensis KCTC 3621]|nr:hypothetical protein JC2156_16380 [Weissella koreensis KCTC 3621]